MDKNKIRTKLNHKEQITVLKNLKDEIKININNSPYRYDRIIQTKFHKFNYGKLIIIFFIISTIANSHIINSFYSLITLRIKNPGTNKIFHSSQNNKCPDITIPDLVQINGVNLSVNDVIPEYTFSELDNNVTLIWYDFPYTTNCLFFDCLNITEINFSLFDTSKVTNMGYMFWVCRSLQSLDLSNFNTSNVINMHGMFQGCKNLQSLNLSNFDTSNVINMRNMFDDCYRLTCLDLSNFNTSKVENMLCMFDDCRQLTSLDLSSFDTANVYNMHNMFSNCRALTSLDLSNFNISKVELLYSMFQNCYSLRYLNLNNFDTSLVQDFNNMFTNCYSLISLNLSNFIVNTNANVNNMFFQCKNLEYINLKNFNEIHFQKNNNIFYNVPDNIVICVNNVNYDTISQIFDNSCFNISCSYDWNSHKKKIILETNSCTDDCTLTNYKYEYNYKCYQTCISGTYNNNYKCIDCYQDCKECEGPYTLNNTNCISCASPDKVLKFGNCVDKTECKRGLYYNETTRQNNCICDLKQCFTCNIESFNRKLCSKCEINYYPFYDYDNIYYPYLNCSKSPIAYYLDNEDLTYKSCYLSCNLCDKSGNENEHNCKECKYGYNFEIHFGLFKNCYINCSYYHYFYSDISFCTIKKECPKGFDKLIEDRNECVFNCSEDEYYKYEFRKHCYKNCPPNSTLRKNITELEGFNLNKIYFCKPICYEEKPFEILYTQECVKNCAIKYIIDKSCILNFKMIKIENADKKEEKGEKQEKLEKEEDNIKAYDIMSKNMEKGFTSEEYDTSGLENGKNDVVQFEKMTFTLTTTENQLNEKENSNITTVDLGDCEKLLRIAYNIQPNEKLYMKKIDVVQDGMKTPKIVYDVYSKLNGSNLTKLNLSHCPNSKVDISIPTEITESIDKLNSSSGYYNDICYTATSDSGTDIILNDRKTEFVESNKTVCQENCLFSEYDKRRKKAKCSCDIEESSSTFANIHINKTKLYENFINFKNNML